METSEIIKRIEAERKRVNAETYSAEGLLRLQKVMQDYDGEYKLVWSDDLLKELKSRPEVKSLKTGIVGLDGIIGGFRPQQLITISAHTKHGKTAFGLFLLEQLQNLSPVMIPLEQSNEEIVLQREESGYSIPRFLSPQKLSALITIDWIEERIAEGIAKHNTKLVLIDHLGYINDFGEKGQYKNENQAYRITRVMQGLKNLAKKWNVIIITLVHISQADESKPPTLQELKGSSSIAQESDLVVMLWRKNSAKGKIRVYEDRTLVSVMANRRTGKNGNVGLDFDTSTGRFSQTEKSNSWVEAMERSAQRSAATEDEFNEL